MAIMNFGEIVYKGKPADAISSLNGRVWRKSIERSEKDHYKKMYKVISDKMVAGKPQIHVLDDSNPGGGFVNVEPNLEDVFFKEIHFKEM